MIDANSTILKEAALQIGIDRRPRHTEDARRLRRGQHFFLTQHHGATTARYLEH
ncbi:MAG: hypothetical protein ACRDVC_09145 [Acidimicrobiales bacterium]